MKMIISQAPFQLDVAMQLSYDQWNKSKSDVNFLGCSREEHALPFLPFCLPTGSNEEVRAGTGMPILICEIEAAG